MADTERLTGAELAAFRDWKEAHLAQDAGLQACAAWQRRASDADDALVEALLARDGLWRTGVLAAHEGVSTAVGAPALARAAALVPLRDTAVDPHPWLWWLLTLGSATVAGALVGINLAWTTARIETAALAALLGSGFGMGG